jgi:hypothetical protein
MSLERLPIIGSLITARKTIALENALAEELYQSWYVENTINYEKLKVRLWEEACKNGINEKRTFLKICRLANPTREF